MFKLKIKNLICALFLALSVVASPSLAFAQTGNQSLWYVNVNKLQPVINSYGLKIPSLSSSGNPCVTVSSTGIFGTSTCLTAGAAYWTYNGSLNNLYPATTTTKVAIGTTTSAATLTIQGASTDATNNLLYVASSSGTQFLKLNPNGNLFVGPGSNPNVNSNINLLVQGVSDARLGVAVADKGTFMSVGDASTYGGLFAYNYLAGLPMNLALNQFGGNVGIATTTNINDTLTIDGTYKQYLPNGGYFQVDDSGDYDRFSVDLHAAPLSGFPRAYMFLNAEEGFTVSPDANTGVSFSLNNGGYQFNYQTHSNSYDANGWVITNATSSGGFFKTVLGGFLMGYDNIADGSSAYIGQISNWGKAAVNVHGTNATEGVMAASDYETFMWLNAPADEGTFRTGQTATSSYIRTTGNLPFYILNAASKVGIGTSTPEHPFVVASTSGQAMFSVRSTGALGINNNVGTAGQVLQSNGNAAPTWVATSSLGTGQVVSGTAGQVAYYASTGAIVSGTSTIFITGEKVGIGDLSPLSALTVGASDAFQVDSTGRVFANAGASGAGNLAYSFVGDTNTGIYNAAADTIRIQTGGTDQVTFANGAVGIASSTLTSGNRLAITCVGNSTGLCIDSYNSSGLSVLRVLDSGSAIFGRNLTQLTATPITLSLGGSYGNGAPGSATNLKFDLYNDGTTRNGIGMSASLMEFRVGTGNAIGIYTNNGTLAAMFTSTQRLGLGTSTPAFQYDQFSTATTTIRLDSNHASRGGCLIIKDADGSGYTYLAVNNGVGTFSTTACN